MYKLQKPARFYEDISFAFAREIITRHDERINNKIAKGNFHERIFKENFGFPEHLEKATQALSFAFFWKGMLNRLYYLEILLQWI